MSGCACARLCLCASACVCARVNICLFIHVYRVAGEADDAGQGELETAIDVLLRYAGAVVQSRKVGGDEQRVVCDDDVCVCLVDCESMCVGLAALVRDGVTYVMLLLNFSE